MAKTKPSVCFKCKKSLKCKCYEFDIAVFTVYFCSPKCMQKFADDNHMDIDDKKFAFSHKFDCKQYGYFDKKWVKALQKEYLWKMDFFMKREHYWHRKVEQLCPHKKIIKSETLKDEFFCLDCSKYFKKKDLPKGVKIYSPSVSSKAREHNSRKIQ